MLYILYKTSFSVRKYMYSENDWGNRGEHIIPSARKSIHSHTCCPFGGSESAMGKFGIEKRNAQQKAPFLQSPLQLGQDVVDNAQSKYAQILSAEQFEPKEMKRRNSWNSDHDNITDDDRKMLSKSLPELFSTHSYCSDESQSGESESQNLTDHAHFQSCGSTQFPSNYNRFLPEYDNDEVQLPRPPVIFENESSCPRDVQINETNYMGKICAILIPIMCILAYGLSESLPVMQNKNISTADIYDRLKFNNDMSAIGKTYKLNQDTILEIQVGKNIVLPVVNICGPCWNVLILFDSIVGNLSLIRTGFQIFQAGRILLFYFIFLFLFLGTINGYMLKYNPN